MEVNIAIERYTNARHRFYEWRDELDFARMTMLALAFACLTGLGAFIRVYTPFSPVPFTAQVFFVLLSGAVLGKYWGGISQALYVGIGLVGMPWFAGGTGGVTILYGATAGYLFGFVLASFLVGWLTDSYPESRKLKLHLPVMFLGILVIYACGVPVLALNQGIGLLDAALVGGGIFLAFDIVKAVLAAGAGKVLLTKQAF
jgi:biotin transport system substrate-specific component